MMGLCCFRFIYFSSSTLSCLEAHSLPPPVVSHIAVMLLLLFTTGRLTLIFALPWLSVLCVSVVVYIPSSPSLSLHCPHLTCNYLFHALFFSNIHFDFPLPPSPPLSPLFLTLVMSALACFGVTNHPLRNLRANSKHPPTQKPCITIGCCLPVTTHLALLLCVCPPACPALP